MGGDCGVGMAVLCDFYLENKNRVLVKRKTSCILEADLVVNCKLKNKKRLLC